MNSWVQNYNPFHNAVLSTAIAILPTGLLFYLLAVRKTKPHIAGFSSAMLAIGIAVLAAGMPVRLALASFAYGAVFGWLPISWIVLNGMFLYNLTVETGQFEVMKESVGAISPNRRIQAPLIAFSFGAFIEGAAGFGTPIAICSALLVGLGFHPYLCGCFVPDCQYFAGFFWVSWHTHNHVGGGDESSFNAPISADRKNSLCCLHPSPLLAGADHVFMEADAGGPASNPGGWADFCRNQTLYQ